jgi:hypothetical protein
MALGWRGQYARYKDFYLNVLSLYKKRADLRMFLEVMLSLATVIIFSLFALRPTVITIISLVKEIDEKEAVVAALDQKISDLQVARNVYSQELPNIPVIEDAIPTSPSPDIIVRQIEGLSSKNSVQVLGVSVGELTLVGKEVSKNKNNDLKPLPAGTKEMTISIGVTGTFQNLNAVVKDIENLRIPIKVDILGVNASSTEAGRIIVAVISGRIPFLENEN